MLTHKITVMTESAISFCVIYLIDCGNPTQNWQDVTLNGRWQEWRENVNFNDGAAGIQTWARTEQTRGDGYAVAQESR
jgi:hypothetical protein